MLFAVFGWIALAGALCWPFLLYRIISKASKDRSAGVECFLLALLSLDFCLWLFTVFTALPHFIMLRLRRNRLHPLEAPVAVPPKL